MKQCDELTYDATLDRHILESFAALRFVSAACRVCSLTCVDILPFCCKRSDCAHGSCRCEHRSRLVAWLISDESVSGNTD